jgi:hypothetical protein
MSKPLPPVPRASLSPKGPGGGRARDSHHTHDPREKGGRTT